MGAYAGPDVSESGLVLALDGASTKSFKGEATTNVVTNTNLDTGWSKGYNTNIQWNDYPPPDNVDSQVVSFVDSDGDGYGYWYSYGDYAPQSPSTTYTISVYARTVGSDWSIRAYTANNSETGRQWTNIVTVPGDGKWHRVVFNSITTPADTQSDSLSFNFTSIPAGQRCWLCAPQMEAKSYATTFTTGTRGSTVATGGGWADMSGNGNHGQLFNGVRESSDNLGALVFDGSNDYISINQFDHTATNTVEMWFKKTADLLYACPYAWGYLPTQRWQFASGDENMSIYYHTNNGGTSVYEDSGINVTTSEGWVHIVVTADYDNNQYKSYKNGSLVQTGDLNNQDWSYVGSQSYNFIDICRNVSNNNGFMSGNVSVLRIYRKVLTASEIQQNFNALRGRFGI